MPPATGSAVNTQKALLQQSMLCWLHIHKFSSAHAHAHTHTHTHTHTRLSSTTRAAGTIAFRYAPRLHSHPVRIRQRYNATAINSETLSCVKWHSETHFWHLSIEVNLEPVVGRQLAVSHSALRTTVILLEIKTYYCSSLRHAMKEPVVLQRQARSWCHCRTELDRTRQQM